MEVMRGARQKSVSKLTTGATGACPDARATVPVRVALKLRGACVLGEPRSMSEYQEVDSVGAVDSVSRVEGAFGQDAELSEGKEPDTEAILIYLPYLT